MMASETVATLPNEQSLQITDEQAARLHHRSVLGEELSESEKNALNEWYELQDRLEAEQIGLPARRRFIARILGSTVLP